MLNISLMNENDYNIFITKEAHDKMRAYVDLCEKEIGWFGYVDRISNGFLIKDVYLLKQQVHATTTEIDPQATIDYFASLNEEEKDYYFKHNKIWGHSHVNMAPNPSGQDDSQGEALAKDVDDFYIRLITNKSGVYHITVYDKERGLKVTTDKIGVYDPEYIQLKKDIAEEIKEKVSEKTYSTVSTSSGSSSNKKYSWYDDDEYWERKSSYGWVNSATDASKYLPAATTSTKKPKDNISKLNISEIFDRSDYKMIALF